MFFFLFKDSVPIRAVQFFLEYSSNLKKIHIRMQKYIRMWIFILNLTNIKKCLDVHQAALCGTQDAMTMWCPCILKLFFSLSSWTYWMRRCSFKILRKKRTSMRTLFTSKLKPIRSHWTHIAFFVGTSITITLTSRTRKPCEMNVQLKKKKNMSLDFKAPQTFSASCF